MTRQTRTLVIVAAIALVGLVSLGALARRYSQMTPTKSVADLAPGPISNAMTRFNPPEPVPPPAEPGPATEDPAAVSGQEPPAAAEDPSGRLVDAFAGVRADVQAFHKQRPYLAQLWLEEFKGNVSEPAKMKNFQKLVAFRTAKEKALIREGIDLETYNRVRENYRAWLANTPTPDPALGAALESRRARLEEVSLGAYEPIDF